MNGLSGTGRRKRYQVTFQSVIATPTAMHRFKQRTPQFFLPFDLAIISPRTNRQMLWISCPGLGDVLLRPFGHVLLFLLGPQTGWRLLPGGHPVGVSKSRE